MTDLTIGMPVYNNAATLPEALDSLLGQTVSRFRIVISDDASTDGTGALARRYAARDSRITYIRQEKNLGFYGNYKFVADRADTPYFMWAAGDDRWAPRFIEANLAALERDPSLVGSISRVEFVRGRERLGAATGTYAIRGTPKERLARFLAECGVCDMSRLFSVYRTEVLKAAFPCPESFAFDIALCAAIVMRGNVHEVPEVLLFRDRTPVERYVALMRREGRSGVGAGFPGLSITRWLLFSRRIPVDWRIVCGLLAFNLDWHFAYAERYDRREGYGSDWVRRLWQESLGWRLRAPCRALLKR